MPELGITFPIRSALAFLLSASKSFCRRDYANTATIVADRFRDMLRVISFILCCICPYASAASDADYTEFVRWARQKEFEIRGIAVKNHPVRGHGFYAESTTDKLAASVQMIASFCATE